MCLLIAPSAQGLQLDYKAEPDKLSSHKLHQWSTSVQLCPYEYFWMYSYVQKYLENVTIFIFFPVGHHHHWSEIRQSRWDSSAGFQLLLRDFTKTCHLAFRCYSHFLQSAFIFSGSKVIRQLRDKQFHGQMWSVPSLPEEKMKQIKVAININPKEISMQVKEAVTWLKRPKQNISIREIAETLGLAEPTIWYIL